MSELIEFYEKKRRKILTVIWVITFCIVGICLINFVRTKNKFLNSETSNTPALVDGFYDSYTFRTNKLDEVEITLISESLIIQPVNDDEISIELYGDWNKKNEPKVSCNNGILSIVQKEKRGLNLSKRSVLVKIPSHILSAKTNFNIEIVSGSCELSDIFANNINIENVSGRSFLKNIECKESNIENVSGKIQIENSTINELDANVVSGAVYIEGNFDEISCEAVSGSINVSNKKDFERDCDFSTVSGSIKIHLPSDANAKLDCSTGSGTSFNEFTGTKSKKLKEKIGSGKYELEAESMSGSIEIRKN